MTRVEEWTSADTGVGAAIAAGNQLEKGAWALLVMAARVIHKTTSHEKWECHILIIDHWLFRRVQEIASKIKASPTRLVRAVIIPAPNDRGLE